MIKKKIIRTFRYPKIPTVPRITVEQSQNIHSVSAFPSRLKFCARQLSANSQRSAKVLVQQPKR